MTLKFRTELDVTKKINSIEIFKSILHFYTYDINKDATILVAGAGNGLEAVFIKQIFSCNVTAVDLNLSHSIIEANTDIIFSTQDLMELNYPSHSFSLIFCNHVLEHVPDHYKVLSELYRVMDNNGILLIGFPNKNRLFGYINATQKVGLLRFIRWNLHDFGQRLKGKFENSHGAHAGFTQKEFRRDAHKLFNSVIPIRNEYISLKYHNYKSLIKLITYLKLGEFLFPSNYFICIKD